MGGEKSENAQSYMSTTPVQREYFLDSIRAWLMLLGIPFHISLIYSSHLAREQPDALLVADAV